MEIEEIIDAERASLEYNANEDDLLRAIDAAVEEAKKDKEIADVIGLRNEKYWRKGTDLKDEDRNPKRANIVDNRIFMSVETLIPMVTAETPTPEIAGEVDNTIREKLIKGLTIAYEVTLKVKQKLQRIVRSWFIYRLGVWKYRWDEGFILEFVRTDRIGIDPRATEASNCEFIYEWLEDSVENVILKFPKKKKELQQLYPDLPKKKIKYLEFWGGNGEWVAWKLNSILLDKIKNPNFDYDTPENNLFKTAQFPYLFLKVFNLGKQVYDDTSLIEQVITLQDGINKRKCQISDLTDDNQKIIVASSKAISKEEGQKFVNKYGNKFLWLDRGDINDIKIEGGQIGASEFNELQDSKNEIDNIMGVHSTTRGERQEAETLGGRKLLAGADYGRVETIIENIEQLMEDFYNAYLHCIKVYSDEPTKLYNGTEGVELRGEEIPPGTKVLVKKGSTLPVDKASRAEMTIKLAQFGMVDPPTMFEELGYGEEEERTKRLYEWLAMTGKINPEAVAGIQAQPGGEEQKAQQLQKVQQMVSSPEFQKLPDNEKAQAIQKAKQIVEKIKGGQ